MLAPAAQATPRRARWPERLVLRLLGRADTLFDRLYGWSGNPLHRSGQITVALLLVLLVTGLWLIVCYRVGAPYASVARIVADPWVGRWVRGVHRYASDAAVVFTGLHALRMFAQGRSWGPRALAWTSGVLALGVLLAVGLTGYVMAWDAFGLVVAQEAARLLDSLPVLSEPLGRAFTGEVEPSAAFFFVILFLHIAFPLGLGLVLWVHVARVARPALLPSKRVAWTLVALLVVAALVRPAVLAGRATAFQLPAAIPADPFFAFWLPLTRSLGGGAALSLVLGAGVALFVVPTLTRRRGAAAPPPSVVNEELCTGCRQCALDCPYDAITMVARLSGARSVEVARVDPELCVSCGICSGSCAPMGVGPAGRTGRDQLARVRAFVPQERVAGRTVVVACDRGARGWGDDVRAAGAALFEVDCAGNLHSSVVELLVRGGAAGVLVASCPPNDCWNREGARWLEERLFHDREAELQARVDRRRVRVVHANAVERREVLEALRAFVVETTALDRARAEATLDVELTCEATAAGEGAA